MNIHLLTYLTNRIFWFYTVYRYNSALYVKEKNSHRCIYYVCSYVIGCCANMCLGTIKGNVIFNLLGLVLIAQSYPADTKHRIWNILMVYMTGILCDAIPLAMCINRVKNRHLGPGLIVIGNFLFFVVESLVERKLNLKRGYQMQTNHWLAMLSVPVLSIAVCINIMNPEEHRIRESIVLFLLFINILIFYLYAEYHREYADYANLMEISEEDVKKQVEEDFNESICQQFTSSDNITEEEIAAYTEKMAEVKKLAKYKVQDEKKDEDGNYTVSVKVEPSDVFQTLQQSSAEVSKEKIAQGMKETDPGVFASILTESVQKSIDENSYGDPVTVTVKMEKNHSGTYELSETERSKLETAMFPTE